MFSTKPKMRRTMMQKVFHFSRNINMVLGSLVRGCKKDKFPSKQQKNKKYL